MAVKVSKLNELVDDDHATSINSNQIICCSDAIRGETHALKNISVPRLCNVFRKAAHTLMNRLESL